MTLPIEARTAAKWWADRLRGDCHHQVTRPGAATFETAIMEVLAETVGAHQQVLSAEQIDDFEHILARIIDKAYIQTAGWERAKTNANWGAAVRTLMTDYAACSKLRAAFQAAGGGVNCCAVFPIKTAMWISPGSVRVRHGYGAGEVELMEVPK